MADQTLAHYASPAKRQKKSMFPEAGLVTPRAVKSALISCTPGPSTPGTQGASMQRPGTLASPGPAPAQLDAQLSLLREFLSAVYASMSLMRTRGQVTTYANLQKPVEHLCGKNFKVYHLRQIKALYPEAFSWQHARATGADGKEQQQLLLTLHSAHKGAESPSAARLTPAEQNREFEKRVSRFLDLHQGKDTSSVELPLADMPPSCLPASSPASSSSFKAITTTPSKTAGASTLLPGTPQTGVVAKPLFLSPDAATPDVAARRPTTRATPAGLFSPVSRPPRATHTPGPAARRTGNLFGTPDVTAAAAAPRSVPSGAFERPGAPTKVRRLEFGRADAQGAGAAAAPTERSATAAVKGAAAQAAAAAAAGGAAVKAGAAGVIVTGVPPGVARAATGAAAVASADARSAGSALDAAVAAVAAAVGGKAPLAAAVPVQPLSNGLSMQLSPGLMAKLRQGSVLAKSADVRQERRAAEHAEAVAMVPRTFDVVRGIFGDKGPVVQPTDEVVRQLRQRCTFSSGLSLDQARQQVNLLMRMAPHWIKQESGSGGTLGRMFLQLRIDRKHMPLDVRAHLVRAAAAPATALELQADVDANAAA